MSLGENFRSHSSSSTAFGISEMSGLGRSCADVGLARQTGLTNNTAYSLGVKHTF